MEDVPGPGVDEPLAWYNNGSRMTLMADRQGSVAGVVNDSGALAALNSYDEYGLPGTGNAGRYQYTGQKYMSEFGWYDYKARNYSMTLGRFVQPDPSGFAGGSNLYEYAGSSPTTFTDPLGLAPGGAGLDTIAIDPCAGIEGCSNVEVTGQRLVDGALNPGLVSTIVKDAGTEGAGPAGSVPQNTQNISCSTRLPNGQTVGQVVQKSIANIESAAGPYDAGGAGEFGAFFATVQSGGPIDFKRNFKGSASPAFLGDAGNFAYGAVASGIGYARPFAEFGAGAYAAKNNKFMPGNPFGEDDSAARTLAPGYATNGCHQ